MSNEELLEKIEQISATIGMDKEDDNLDEKEKQALYNYAKGDITTEEYYEEYRGNVK